MEIETIEIDESSLSENPPDLVEEPKIDKLPEGMSLKDIVLVNDDLT